MPPSPDTDRPERGDRLWIAVIGYSSPIQPGELATLSETALDRAIPVRVVGLKRVFDQRIGRRTDDVEPDDGTETPRIDHHELVPTTTGLETDEGIEPIPAYVDGRPDGAAALGEEFYEEFLATTETAAVYRPSDPGPTTGLLETEFGDGEYYCAC